VHWKPSLFILTFFFYRLTVWNFNRYSVYCMWSLQQKKQNNRIAKNPLRLPMPTEIDLNFKKLYWQWQCHDVSFFTDDIMTVLLTTRLFFWYLRTIRKLAKDLYIIRTTVPQLIVYIKNMMKLSCQLKKKKNVIFSKSMKKIWKKSHDSLIVNKTVMISSETGQGA
jgi:hypothetical protein